MFDRTVPLLPPCFTGRDWDHDLEIVDDSFDHAFGTETIQYLACSVCGYVSDVDPYDYFNDVDPGSIDLFWKSLGYE